jgi:hypothetical protein
MTDSMYQMIVVFIANTLILNALVIAWISDLKAMKSWNNTVPCYCQTVIGQEFPVCKDLLHGFSQIDCWEEQN